MPSKNVDEYFTYNHIWKYIRASQIHKCNKPDIQYYNIYANAYVGIRFF